MENTCWNFPSCISEEVRTHYIPRAKRHHDHGSVSCCSPAVTGRTGLTSCLLAIRFCCSGLSMAAGKVNHQSIKMDMGPTMSSFTAVVLRYSSFITSKARSDSYQHGCFSWGKTTPIPFPSLTEFKELGQELTAKTGGWGNRGSIDF